MPPSTNKNITQDNANGLIRWLSGQECVGALRRLATFDEVVYPLWSRLVAYVAFQLTFFAAGGVHVPLIMEGDFSFGQYMRNIKTNLSFGAGSQLLSLST